MINEELLDWAIQESIYRVPGSVNDQELFQQIKNHIIYQINNPVYKVIMPSFELISKEDKKPIAMYLECALIAQVLYEECSGLIQDFHSINL